VVEHEAARRAGEEEAARRAAEESAAQAAAAEIDGQADLEPPESVVEPQRPLVLAAFTPLTPTEPVASDATGPEIDPVEPQTARAEEPGAQTAELPIYRWFRNS
jgi:hypothetical protein